MIGLFTETNNIPGGIDTIFISSTNTLKVNGVNVVYCGGSNYALEFLERYGSYCITLDTQTAVQPLHYELKDHPGTLYCQCSATPVSSLISGSIGILDDIVDVWMPVLDTEIAIKEMYSQFPKVLGKILPIFNVTIPPVYTSIYDNFVLYGYSNLEQITPFLKGNQIMSYPTNSKGLIANYLPTDQFQPNHSEFECGAFAVSINLRATNYNVQNDKDPAKIVEWAENEYSRVTGSNSPGNTLGVSINNMHTMLKDSQTDSSGGLHYWDLPINSGTKQTDDIARIKGAIKHGYAVIATVSEQSVFDLDLNKNPYWWGPSGNHILTFAGIAADGNLLCIDPANVAVGNLQKPGTVLPWPRRYDAGKIANQWATIVQFPWLPDIPSNDPLEWGEYQPPKQTNEPITMFYDPNGKQIIYMVNNTAIYRIQL